LTAVLIHSRAEKPLGKYIKAGREFPGGLCYPAF
jgi:hypothetical protein